MNHSYLYTKRFIDDQIKILNQPLRLTDSLKEILQQQDDSDRIISESQLKKVISKLNTKIRKRNQNKFSNQITNQIVQQVLKLEENNLSIVNEQLTKIHYVLKPIINPDFDELSNQTQIQRIMELGDLIKEFPEPQYILISNKYDDSEEEDSETDEVNADENILVQDDQETVERKPSQRKQIAQHRREIIKKVHQVETRDASLIEKYTSLRRNLFELYESIRSNCNNIDYLKRLIDDAQVSLRIFKIESESHNNKDQIYDSDEETADYDISTLQANLLTNANVIVATNKCRVLSEKLSYNVNSTGITSTELKQSLKDLNSSD